MVNVLISFATYLPDFSKKAFLAVNAENSLFAEFIVAILSKNIEGISHLLTESIGAIGVEQFVRPHYSHEIFGI